MTNQELADLRNRINIAVSKIDRDAVLGAILRQGVYDVRYVRDDGHSIVVTITDDWALSRINKERSERKTT